MEPTTETLRVLRNVLLRAFVIGAGLGLLFAIATFAGWNTWISIGIRLFHTDTAVLTLVILQFFAALRFFLYFCVLVPALALHWTLRAESRRR